MGTKTKQIKRSLETYIYQVMQLLDEISFEKVTFLGQHGGIPN